MPVRHKRLVIFICQRIQDGKKPCQPAPGLIHAQRNPVPKGKDGIPDHMTGFLDDRIRPTKDRQFIGRPGRKPEDDAHRHEGWNPIPNKYFFHSHQTQIKSHRQRRRWLRYLQSSFTGPQAEWQLSGCRHLNPHFGSQRLYRLDRHQTPD